MKAALDVAAARTRRTLSSVLLQVGVEKTKVNLENEAAQVEAEKCGVIAKDVTELQARCEKDLAAAEPLVAQAEAALDTLNKKDLGKIHSLAPA